MALHISEVKRQLVRASDVEHECVGRLASHAQREQRPVATRAPHGNPLTAEQLSWVARENEAPPVMLTLLGALPRGRFASVDDVAVALQQGLDAQS